ncbi:MAG: asparagine synthase (glutamine-hydrolyzing) [Psychroflexus halocasei]
MCGFLGEFSFKNTLTNHDEFHDLLSLSKHRGPDSSHSVAGNFYQLGFNRLALLDITSSGDQPIKSPSGKYHIVFNGEIYNFKILSHKYDLKNLRSTNDTEVIVHLLDLIGVEKTLKQLNGMFAIAIIDISEQELYLTRDFAGIKPHFYGLSSQGVVFASQFDQIFKHPWHQSDLKLRKEIIKEYFSFGYMQAPNTVFEQIFQINPGECLHIDKDNNQQIIDILKFPKISNPKKTLAETLLEDKLKNAVNLQLNADRPLASFLSGGVDSSLITSLAKNQKESIKAFTLEIEDKGLNEAEYAKKYANHLNVEHKIVKVKPQELLKEIDNHFKSFSEPFGDYSSIPTYLVTKKAKVTHTAMLSGDGGDELFYGYPRMYDFVKRYRWFKMPLLVRKNLVRMTNKVGITDTYAPYLKSLKDFWLNKHSKLPNIILDKAFDKVNYSKEFNSLYDLQDINSKEDLQHFTRWNEFYAHMQRVLIKVDRTSMQNSLEVRVPFLDKDIINYSWDKKQDISKLSLLKRPLKLVVQNYIPQSLMLSTKKGFSVPLKNWLRNEIRSDLELTVFNYEFYGKELFDVESLRNYVKDFLENIHDNEWGVWHIYAWQKWAINQNLTNLK